MANRRPLELRNVTSGVTAAATALLLLYGCGSPTRSRQDASTTVAPAAPAGDAVQAALPAVRTPQALEAQAELGRLASLVAGWHTIPLTTGTGELALTPADSLTVEQLRGAQLDPAPPVLGEKTAAYDPRMADDCPPDAMPYVANGIAPFRFKYFNGEFNYGGWHNFDMQDYAATHGFNILSPYIRTVEQVRHWPKGTQVLNWGGFTDWHKWFGEHGVPDGRYDRLTDFDLVQLHTDAGYFKRDPTAKDARSHGDLLMIDQEHPVLSPERLREQEWYPKTAPNAERAAFEKRYYDGYGQTYISSVLAARRAGWNNISIYGWYPYGRTWGGLEKVEAEPGTDFAWNAFGTQILPVVDIVNNSVYCFYWTPQNVAYTLANVDMNMRMVRSADPSKPVRPYYWTLLHGGGGGWRWWRDQPIANEEQRAMTAMAFFTGIDGFDSWNWSGTGSHHTVALRSKVKRTETAPDGTTKDVQGWEYLDVMVGREFQAQGDKGETETFKRYDVLHVLDQNETDATVRFQKIRPRDKNCGADPAFPAFTMPEKELMPLLRRKSEPVGAMVEGMALVKPFEGLLRHGEVKIDVPAQEQFGKTLPIVRRVKLAPWHVLITYDPSVVYGGAPREIVLQDFDGVQGRTLRLPADAQTRVFVLEEAQP